MSIGEFDWSTFNPPPLKPMAVDTASLMLPSRNWVYVQVRCGMTPEDSRLKTCKAAKSYVIELMKLCGVTHAGPSAIKGGFGLQLINEPKTLRVLFIETKN